MTTPEAHRAIIHMDLDSFFVSVECLRDRRLLGQPLIIGGDKKRGVVTCCSYEARRFGVHSGMPTGLALQLCPDALVISGDMEAYTQYSSVVTDIVREESPLFEKSSIDEFYVDISGMEKFFGAYKWARQLRHKVIENTGLPISMGVSVNKMVSKVATGEFKPNGEKWIPPGIERDFIAPLSVKKIPMVGKQTTQYLFDMGIKTVKTLREMPVMMLQRAFGRNGVDLWHKANARDTAPVVPYSERKSISTECTFSHDTIDVKKLRSILTAMVEKLTHKLREEKKLTSCITIKIRYSNFDTETKQIHLPYTSSDHTLIKHAHQLFEQLYSRRMRLRLVGVRLSSLVSGQYQIDMFDDTEESIRLYQAMDQIKYRHGVDSVIRAATMDLNKRIRMDVNPFNGNISGERRLERERAMA